MNIPIGLLKEMFRIIGTWLAFTFLTAAALYGIFYIMGFKGADLLIILWVSVVASSIFAVPYEEYWDLRRFRVMFGVTASLVLASLLFMTASILALNVFAYHADSGYVMAGIFITGTILAILTRDYWSLEKLRTIKNLTIYGIMGEAFVLGLGDVIAGDPGVDPWVRAIFLAAAIVVIAVPGIALARMWLDERRTG